jgi:glycosyltransferase involved in cell wall biosynthesis
MQGKDVAIITFSSTVSDAYSLDPRIRRMDLDIDVESHSVLDAITHNVEKIRRLRRAVVSMAPGVVISFVDRVNVVTLLACIGMNVPVIISERIHPVYHGIGPVWSMLRRLTYPLADALVVQSETIRAWADGIMPSRRTWVVPNPVGGQFSAGDIDAQDSRKPVVLAVGRLTTQKGFDLLIRAFHSVAPRHLEWRLVIIGDGPREAELKDLATKLLRRGSALFLGSVNDLEPHYRTAGLFVLPSRFEGFPNVLLEAMACGCAVIATTCPGGSSDIIRDGFNGVLTPPEDVGALANAIERLMTDAGERVRLGAQAVEVSSRFRTDRIAALWEGIVCEVCR